jgi:hypothetical protein
MEPPWVSLSHSSDTMPRGLEDATYIPLLKADYRIKTVGFSLIKLYVTKSALCRVFQHGVYRGISRMMRLSMRYLYRAQRIDKRDTLYFYILM